MDEYINYCEKLREEYSRYNRYAILGVGMQGRFAYEYLKSQKLNVYGFYDSNKNKRNTIITDDYICHPMESIKDIPKDVLCLITPKGGIESIIELAKKYGKSAVPYGLFVRALNIEKVKSAYDALEDDLSKNIVKEILLYDINQNTDTFEKIYSDNQYFCVPAFQKPIPGEVFFDIGAYVGDTTEKYIYTHSGTFNKIFAFEPGQKQVKAFIERAKRLSVEWAKEEDIEIFEGALGAVCGYDMWNAGSNSGALTNHGKVLNPDNQNSVKITTLDAFIQEHNSNIDCRKLFIKVDIEGDEADFLVGSKYTIENYRPKMAICIYHRPEDIFKILLNIKEMNDKYRYCIRHHGLDASETVLYCY